MILLSTTECSLSFQLGKKNRVTVFLFFFPGIQRPKWIGNSSVSFRYFYIRIEFLINQQGVFDSCSFRSHKVVNHVTYLLPQKKASRDILIEVSFLSQQVVIKIKVN